jgi:hypothetical protein
VQWRFVQRSIVHSLSCNVSLQQADAVCKLLTAPACVVAYAQCVQSTRRYVSRSLSLLVCRELVLSSPMQCEAS